LINGYLNIMFPLSRLGAARRKTVSYK